MLPWVQGAALANKYEEGFVGTYDFGGNLETYYVQLASE